MSKLTEEQMARGRTRFLEDHPDVKARIDALTERNAFIFGIRLKDLREAETMRELRVVAQAKEIDATEFFWGYVADNAAELATMLARRD
jgi:hypothetical protein